MLVIYGSPAVGKTTLVEYLRNNSDLNISELDEEILKENNGVWPNDAQYRNSVIVQQVLQRIAEQEANSIFVTSGLNATFVQNLRKHNGKVALLFLTEQKLIERNNKRIVESGHDVIDQIKLNLNDQERLKKEVGFDYTIDATRSVEEIADEIIKLERITRT
jgi:broad-specificity NMP kinase